MKILNIYIFQFQVLKIKCFFFLTKVICFSFQCLLSDLFDEIALFKYKMAFIILKDITKSTDVLILELVFEIKIEIKNT